MNGQGGTGNADGMVRAISPGQVKVIAVRPVLVDRHELSWTCTNCSRGHDGLFWLVFEAHHSDVPLAVPMCERCVRQVAPS